MTLVNRQSVCSLSHRGADPEAEQFSDDAGVSLAGGLLEGSSSTPGHPGHGENVSISVWPVTLRGYSPDVSAPVLAQVSGLEVQGA